MSSRPILIIAGGTGGHVFPALAVARALQRAARDVVWLGTRRGMEARIVPLNGIAIEWISVSGLRGKRIVDWLAAPFKLSLALMQALRILWRRRPAAVLGMGGFVTGPGGLAAWLSRTPLLIHEQNAVAGLTNRLLAPLATEVFEAFPHSFAEKRGARHVGNPLRQEFEALPPPEQRLAQRGGAMRLLVLGGSQGALVLNQTVPRALQLLAARQRPEVWHQAGAGTLGIAAAAYREAGLEPRLDAFIEEVTEAYAWADLVLCRAGALTVSELAAAGVAALLVPFPHAVDDHQTHNAHFLADAGAAILLPQGDLTAERLAGELGRLALDRSRLLQMAQAARSLATLDAAARVAAACIRLAETRGRAG